MVKTEKFTSDFFKGNRVRLRELASKDGPIVLTANGVLQRNGDGVFPFRQDSSFWYFTGLNLADLILVIDSSEEYIILPEQSFYTEVFDGHIDPRKLSEKSGIKQLLSQEKGIAKLTKLLEKSEHVLTIAPPPEYISSHHFYTNPARTHLAKRVESINPNIAIDDIGPDIIAMRSIKQSIELKAIQKAIDITVHALVMVKANLGTYKSENEIEAAILSYFRSHHSVPAYIPIIATGKNACSMHYNKNSSVFKSDNLLLIDVGAESNNYAADITRTYSINSPSDRQSAIYDSVHAVQSYAFSLLKPGVILKDYEQKVSQRMGEELRKLKLIKDNKPENIQKYFPTLTSHFLGLDVHDVGDYKKPLEAGMVLTVEPGIYIPEEEIGIRIEDDAVITEDGNRILTDSLPSILN